MKNLLRLTLISSFLFATGSLFGQWNGNRDSTSSLSVGSSSLVVVADSSVSVSDVAEVIAPATVPAEEEKDNAKKASAAYVSRYRHGNRAE